MKAVPDPFHLPATLLALGCLLLSGATALSELPLPPPSAKKAEAPIASIHFAEPKFNFGSAPQGSIVRHQFTFTNTGQAVLKLREPLTSCHCTTVLDWTKSVEPGATGSITVSSDTLGFDSGIAQFIGVFDSDSPAPIASLSVSGKLTQPVKVSPMLLTVRFDEVESLSAEEVRITNRTTTPLVLEEPISTNPCFSAELKTFTKGVEYLLLVRRSGPLVTGRSEGIISMKSNLHDFPAVRVNVVTELNGSLAFEPDRLVIPSHPVGERTRDYQIMVRNKGEKPIHIEKAEISIPDATVEPIEVEDGRLYCLAVKLPENPGGSLDAGAQITIATNHPAFPLVRIPVSREDEHSH
jgi:hypothetical protein